jgi:hypothetical protein
MRRGCSSRDELFGVLYGGDIVELPARLRGGEHSRWAEEIHARCAELPQFERLVNECRGEAVAAGAAVKALMNALGDPQPDEQQHVVRRRLREGCMRAEDAIVEVREALAALEHVDVGRGAGTSTSTGGERTGDAAVSLARKLRELPRLRELARLAGRVRQIAAARRRHRVRRMPEETGDVERGDDPGAVAAVRAGAARAPAIAPGGAAVAARARDVAVRRPRDGQPRRGSARRLPRQERLDGRDARHMGDGGRARAARPGPAGAAHVRVARVRRAGEERGGGRARREAADRSAVHRVRWRHGHRPRDRPRARADRGRRDPAACRPRAHHGRGERPGARAGTAAACGPPAGSPS